MNSYSQNKFMELSVERRCRVMLTLIERIEDNWSNTHQKSELLKLFADYFQWSDFFSCEDTVLKRLGHLQYNIEAEMSLRQLLDIAVPLERYLNLAVKDEHILKIKEGDDQSKQREIIPLCFVLDHLRSSFNVGSLFRTAECLGIEHIYLVGYTPTPEDSGVQKTAMGTEGLVKWSSHNHLSEVLEILKSKGYEIVALETVPEGEKLQNFIAQNSMAFVVGNERFGLSQSVLNSVDRCVEIPMKGVKNSLNVANTLSIASFEVVRQWLAK